MIHTMSIQDYSYNNKYDSIFLVVRSLAALRRRGDPILSVAEHLPILSPDTSLFNDYLYWRSHNLWNNATFNTKYRRRFLEQLYSDETALADLVEIGSQSKSGKQIALLCYCKDVNLCHRKILGEVLLNCGLEVTIA